MTLERPAPEPARDLKPADLTALAADDAWLDRVAARTPGTGDPLAHALVDWLDRLDAEHVPSPVAQATSRRSRRPLAFISVAAVVVVLTGAGAAASGLPLQRLLTGEFTPVSQQTVTPPKPSTSVDLPTPSTSDLPAEQATQLLDRVAAILDGSRARGSILAADRALVNLLLTQARHVIASMPAGPPQTDLGRRAALLTQRLAALVDTSHLPSSTAGNVDRGDAPEPKTSKQAPESSESPPDSSSSSSESTTSPESTPSPDNSTDGANGG